MYFRGPIRLAILFHRRVWRNVVVRRIAKRFASESERSRPSRRITRFPGRVSRIPGRSKILRNPCGGNAGPQDGLKQPCRSPNLAYSGANHPSQVTIHGVVTLVSPICL